MRGRRRALHRQGRHRLRRRGFYLGLALDPAYIEGFVEDCLERIGEDDPEGEWEEGDREMALEVLEAECEVRTGRPAGF